MASRSAIARWVADGVAARRHYLLVAYDTFDGSDYPVYIDDYASFVAARDRAERVVEVYDLFADVTAQLSEPRAWHPPPLPLAAPVAVPPPAASPVVQPIAYRTRSRA